LPDCGQVRTLNLTDLPTIFLIAMDEDEAARQVAQRLAMRRLYKYVTLFINIILTALTGILQDESTRMREPYHTSALTGKAWVMELVAGHPNCIRCELGVSREVFMELVQELRQLGHRNSKYVSLEEQLAIFLYMSVTGLTIRHVGEHFQRSNETISR